MILFSKVKNIIFRLFNNIFVFGLFVLLMVSATTYLLLGHGAADALVEQTLHRQQIISRSGARSLEAFLSLVGRSTVSLAREYHIYGSETDKQMALDKFVKRWEGTPVVEVVFINRDGILTHIANKDKTGETGYSVADREYFTWARNAQDGEYFISSAIIGGFGIARGQALVPVVAPIFDNGRFSGVVGTGILLSSLTHDFLDPLKISANTEIYILRLDGMILYAQSKELTGKNVFDELKSYPFLGSKVIEESVKKILAEPQPEGKLDIAYPTKIHQIFPITRRLIAYNSMNIASNHWVLAVSTPVEDALIFMGPFYIRHAEILIIMFVGFLLFSIRLARYLGVKEGFRAHGRLHREHDHKI